MDYFYNVLCSFPWEYINNTFKSLTNDKINPWSYELFVYFIYSIYVIGFLAFCFLTWNLVNTAITYVNFVGDGLNYIIINNQYFQLIYTPAPGNVETNLKIFFEPFMVAHPEYAEIINKFIDLQVKAYSSNITLLKTIKTDCNDFLCLIEEHIKSNKICIKHIYHTNENLKIRPIITFNHVGLIIEWNWP